MLTAGAILLGRYHVVRLIARGGMGAVYEAQDDRLDTRVALKECCFTEEPMRRQFEREARLLACLRHPAITRVIDHFSEGDGQFLVMEFVSGTDLGRMLDERGEAFPLADVLRWGDQILEALDYLHNQSPPIVHRDIKPNNLKLAARQQVILLDFGLAKRFASDTTQPSAASVYGYTPNYAPLEQIQGTGTDARSDLFAVASTLYALMTNVAPIDALSRATAVVQGHPDPIQRADALNPLVSAPIADVLASGMSIHPDRRPATAAQMRASLREAAEATAQRQPDLSDASTLVLPRRGVDARAPSTAPGQTAQIPRHDETLRREPSVAAPTIEPGSSPRRRGYVYAALALVAVAVATAAWLLFLRLPESSPPAAANPAGLPPDGAQQARSTSASTATTAGTVRHVLAGHAVGVTSAALSPDGDYAVTSDREGKIRLWKTQSGGLLDTRSLETLGTDVTSIAFSPDGKRIAVALSYNAKHNGGLAAVLDRNGDKLGEVKVQLAIPLNLLSAIAFAPDGVHLAGGGTNGTVYLWNIGTTAVKFELEGQGQTTQALAFAPVDPVLAAVGNDPAVKIWDLQTGKLRHTLTGHTADVTAAAFSSDGALASGGLDQTVRVWDVSSGASRQILRVGQPVYALAFSPDGRFIATDAAGDILLWDVRVGVLAATLKGNAGAIGDLAFSPDGRLLLTASMEGTVRLWNAPTISELERDRR